MKNTFGNQVSLTIFGESHGPAIGAVLDGLAAGLPVDEAHIARWMDRRRARGDGLSTSRKEPDTVRFLSGVYNGRTTGTALTLMIENTAQRSGDYAKTAGLARPGHADYTAHVKYQGFEDFRGGGHFSGRLTAPLVAAGALCQSILAAKGVRIGTHLYRLAGLDDQPFAGGEEKLAAQLAALEEREGFALLDSSREEAMKAAVRSAAAEGDSVGGILETVPPALFHSGGERGGIRGRLCPGRPERQRGQRPPGGAGGPGGHPHQPQRGDQWGHHQRHAPGVPGGLQAHPQHLQSPAHGGSGQPHRGRAPDPGPA